MKQNNRQAAPRHRTRTLLRFCGLFAFLAALVAIGGVSARYAHRTLTNASATAAVFYFASDLLDGETHTLAALNADGTASITFALQNHADALRYAGVDITYTVTVTPAQEDARAAEATVTPADGTLAAGPGSDAAITVSGLQPGQSYTVTAAATAPYTAELSAVFRVSAVDDAVHSDTVDHGAYIEATVWTVDYSGPVTLSWPGTLLPDNTDPWMADWQTADGQKKFEMEANSAHVFRFFKASDTADESEVTVHAG